MTAITIASILTGLRQNIVAMIEEYGTNNIYASISLLPSSKRGSL
jgi:hypothetical protein